MYTITTNIEPYPPEN